MRARRIPLIVILTAACLARAASACAADPAQLVAKLPAASIQAGRKIIDELLGGGEPTVIACCGMLRPSGKGNCVAAETALSGMAYVAGNGPEEQRGTFVGGVIKALDKAKEPEVQAFLISLLQAAGRNESVEPLSRHLRDEKLCDPAASALVCLGTANAGRAVAKALDSAKGKTVLPLVRAAGVLRAPEAAKSVLSHATSPGREVRHAALFALANIPVAEAENVLTKAAAAKELRDRVPATNCLLLFARRMGEAGKKDRAKAICRDIVGTRRGTREAHFVCAALATLVDVIGRDALDDLLAAADHKDKAVRAAALKLAENMKGPTVTKAWARKERSAGPQGRAEILAMLAQRGDKAALPAIVAGLNDKDKAVRLAAIPAAAQLAGASAAPQLLEFLAGAKDDEANAAVREIARLHGPKVISAVASALPKVTAPARVALLKLLGDRGATDQMPAVVSQLNAADAAVRKQAAKTFSSLAKPSDLPKLLDLLIEARGGSQRAALQTAVVTICQKNSDAAGRSKPVLDRLAQTEGAAREPLLNVLAKLGGPAALGAVVAETAVKDDDRRTAAVRVLAAWPDTVAVAPLLKIARESKNLAHHVLAIRGCVRLAGTLPAAKRAPLLEALAAAARREEEKTLIRSAMPTPQAAPKRPAPAPKPARRIPPLGYPDKDGFVSLFNGKDLAGWVGAVNGYGVENGVMYCKPRGGGNLFTAHEFTDFILKFEFKLPAGANNGLAIRSPLRGNPAYNAMELQILDDSAPQYAKLKPYQYHGSIYGVVPAKRGHQKPVGQWNVQEVRAIGPKITVILNGATIVDADISKITKTADGGGLRAHPGLRNKTGHIGWLGHGSRVEFRNIRIRPVLPSYETGPHNVPPKGFVALFNGKDLAGWRGLFGNPLSRAKMTPEQFAAAAKRSWAGVVKHWRVEAGQIVNDGGGPHLCTKKDYGDFELLIDYKTVAGADSGIYLRGTPQVQIWDTRKAGGKWILGANYGSAGLWNNGKHARMPLVHADKPFGQWNRLRIRMAGERVTAWLNGQMTIKDTVMDNYWERGKPIYPAGQIELQTHGGEIRWRNVFIREIPRK